LATRRDQGGRATAPLARGGIVQEGWGALVCLRAHPDPNDAPPDATSGPKGPIPPPRRGNHAPGARREVTITDPAGALSQVVVAGVRATFISQHTIAK